MKSQGDIVYVNDITTASLVEERVLQESTMDSESQESTEEVIITESIVA